MRIVVFTILLAIWPAVFLFAQDYDMQWIQTPTPTSIMDFRDDTIVFSYVNVTSIAFVSTANICDKNGNFLFFTNGINVSDRYGNIMPNGDSLSYTNQLHYEEIYPQGAPADQNVLILPKPGSDNLYYVFHYLPIDTDILLPNFVYLEPTRFYYSVVDMNANMGLGDVVQKNVPIPIPGVQCASKMTAVKHANGRDWWIIRHGFKDNTYIKYLFTPNGISGPFIQNIGPAFEQGGTAYDFYGNSAFNLQGTQMASVNAYSPTVILDFDRCSGEFSNLLVIQNRLTDTTILGGYGLCFSPSGRFLYVNTKLLLNQYDLWSATPNDSVELYKVDSNDYAFMHQQRLGPNGKIYIGTYHGGTSHLHVINHPDSLGLACGFQFKGQECMTSNTNKLPNMVNYKLGALVGSGCDTLISSLPQNPQRGLKNIIQISPNPASDVVKITIADNREQLQLVIYNAVGQVVKQTIISGYLLLDVSDLPNGIYHIITGGDTGKLYKARFVVAR